MVKAWFLNENENASECDESSNYIEEKTLKAISGVILFKIDVDCSNDSKLSKIKKDRGYNYEDEVELTKEKFPNLENMLEGFFREHQHSEEEIRLVLDGGGYFDVRDCEDRWIRVHTRKGDLIVLPTGIYHRFKLDQQMYMRYKRMFITSPIWKASNRDD